MRDKKQVWVYKDFEVNVKKMFPDLDSMYKRTKELNKLLEDMLYGKKG